MKILIGARCVTDIGALSGEDEAIEVCVPAVMAVESKANFLHGGKVPHGAIAVTLEAAIHNLVGEGPGRVLLYNDVPDCEWKRVEGRGFNKKVAEIARKVASEDCGELYITQPGLYHVEIYKVESI